MFDPMNSNSNSLEIAHLRNSGSFKFVDSIEVADSNRFFGENGDFSDRLSGKLSERLSENLRNSKDGRAIRNVRSDGAKYARDG